MMGGKKDSRTAWTRPQSVLPATSGLLGEISVDGKGEKRRKGFPEEKGEKGASCLKYIKFITYNTIITRNATRGE